MPQGLVNQSFNSLQLFKKCFIHIH